MHTIPRVKTIGLLYLFLSPPAPAFAQNPQQPPAPSGAVTAPGTVTPAGFVPAPILQGGEVFLLFPPGSPFLKQDRVDEPEQNNMTSGVPGRIQSIVNIHNPSIEVHRVDRGINTGAAVILVAGRRAQHAERRHGRRRLRPVLLQLRRDHGHPAQPAAARRLQSRRPTRSTTRSRRSAWCARTRRSGTSIRNKIGIMGFSAGAELVAPAAIATTRSTRPTTAPGDPLAGVSSRPDFVGLVYPGPTPFARDPATPDPGERAAGVHHLRRHRRRRARRLGRRVSSRRC